MRMRNVIECRNLAETWKQRMPKSITTVGQHPPPPFWPGNGGRSMTIASSAGDSFHDARNAQPSLARNFSALRSGSEWRVEWVGVEGATAPGQDRSLHPSIRSNNITLHWSDSHDDNNDDNDSDDEVLRFYRTFVVFCLCHISHHLLIFFLLLLLANHWSYSYPELYLHAISTASVRSEM